MPAWGFYKRERERFKQNTLYHIPLVWKGRHTEFVKAICDKHDLPIPQLTYRGHKFHKCMWNEDRINFVENHVTLGILSHEMAHYVRHKLFGCHRHNEELMDLIEELIIFLNEYIMTEKDRMGRKLRSSFQRTNQDE